MLIDTVVLLNTIKDVAINCMIFFLKMLFIYFQRGGEGRRKKERNINGLPLACPLLETWPATQACALTGNQTGDPLVCRPTLNPRSHTSQGNCMIFLNGKQLLEEF